MVVESESEAVESELEAVESEPGAAESVIIVAAVVEEEAAHAWGVEEISTVLDSQRLDVEAVVVEGVSPPSLVAALVRPPGKQAVKTRCWFGALSSTEIARALPMRVVRLPAKMI